MSTNIENSKDVAKPQWRLISQPEITYTANDLIDTYVDKMNGFFLYPERIRVILRKDLKKSLPELEEFYSKIPFDYAHSMMVDVVDIDYFKVHVAITHSVLFDKSKVRQLFELSSKVGNAQNHLSVAYIPADADGNIYQSVLIDKHQFLYRR